MERESFGQPGLNVGLFLDGLVVLAALVEDQVRYLALVVLEEFDFGVHDLEKKRRIRLYVSQLIVGRGPLSSFNGRSSV